MAPSFGERGGEGENCLLVADGEQEKKGGGGISVYTTHNEEIRAKQVNVYVNHGRIA